MTPCTTSCRGEKVANGGEICNFIMPDQDGMLIEDRALVTYESNSEHLDKLQITIASKEKLLSQTALKVLLRKRDRLVYLFPLLVKISIVSEFMHMCVVIIQLRLVQNTASFITIETSCRIHVSFIPLLNCMCPPCSAYWSEINCCSIYIKLYIWALFEFWVQ